MITALHTLIYADDPEAARDFFRDVLEFSSVDTVGGWLIFKTGPSELGVHPSSWEYEGQSGSTSHGPQPVDLIVIYALEHVFSLPRGVTKKPSWREKSQKILKNYGLGFQL